MNSFTDKDKDKRQFSSMCRLKDKYICMISNLEESIKLFQ